MNKTKTLFVALDTKALDDSGTFEGYGSIFGNVDQGGDIVAAGAFKRSLAEHKAAGTMPAMLWQHDARQPIGVWEEMTEDERGLRVRGRLVMDTQLGREAHALMKAGALKGLSIGYAVKVGEWNTETETFTLKDVDLWEVSPVTFPMNRLAGISVVKNTTRCETIRELESLLRDAGGFSKAEAKAIAAGGWAGLKRRDADEASQNEINAALKTLLGNI